MNIIPAIDLYNNACVRLNNGEFNKVKLYSQNPLQRALDFQAQGATIIHIVDLNGAKSGAPSHLDIITNIKKNTELLVQSGGGLRDKKSIELSLQSGIDRVVLGSLAVTDIALIKSLIDKYGVERFVLAFDVNINEVPEVAIKGWLEKTTRSLWDLLQQYESYKDLSILCTDIACDGMLNGPNIELYRQCVNQFTQFQWQASGGVSHLNDLLQLKTTGVSSVVIGKALYEQCFTLQQSLEALELC